MLCGARFLPTYTFFSIRVRNDVKRPFIQKCISGDCHHDTNKYCVSPNDAFGLERHKEARLVNKAFWVKCTTFLLAIYIAVIFYSRFACAETAGTDPEEQRIGYFMDYLTTSIHGEIKDEQTLQPIRKIVENIAHVSERPSMVFMVRVLNDPLYVNASALAGGYIYVGRGLLDMINSMQSDLNIDPRDELAAVLAHEVAHGIYRHPISTIRRQKRLGDIVGGLKAAGTIVGLAGGAMAGYALGTYGTNGLYSYTQQFYVDAMTRMGGSIGAGMGSAFVGSMSGIMAILLHQGFSRGYEEEADKQGIIYLSKAGYDPKAFISVFRKFDKLSKLQRNAQKEADHVHHFLSSEYSLEERIKDLSKQVLELEGR